MRERSLVVVSDLSRISNPTARQSAGLSRVPVVLPSVAIPPRRELNPTPSMLHFPSGRVDIIFLKKAASYTLLILPTRQLTSLHGSILLLKPGSKPLRAFHVFVDASHHAVLLSADKRLGSEVINAVVEAPLHEIGIHLKAG